MKFINKQSQYQSNISPYPTYINSYVRDGEIKIGENSEFLEIDYLFCHQIEKTKEVEGVEETIEKEIVINRSTLRFDETHQPTYIQEGEEELEVYEAILSGIAYNKSKVIDWGKPDLHRVMGMFELSSLTNQETGLVIKELTHVSVQGNPIAITTEQSQQIKQVMIDWLSHKIYIDNAMLGDNFEYEL